MSAILLCAGFGTRMYPLTRDLAKPLLPVAGRPVLDYLAGQLLELPGLDALHLVANARFFHQFEDWAARWRPRLAARGLSLTLHNDGALDNGRRLGAVGDLGLVLDRAGVPDQALVVAADNIFRFSLRPPWDRFRTDDRNLVLALPEADLERRRRTGILELGAADRVLRFHEKPADPPSEWTCPPVYFLSAPALRRVPAFLAERPGLDAPGNFVRYLLDREPVYAFRCDGERFDIGSMASYEEADRRLREEPA